ncbi:MAG: hypothetical protein A2096_15435 [Spirochaetes bacterium GWF1_41_5]|nr:MAG: hypothetical protein A2096_15435 [Spirochaetes bacterium GWF1_41_5]
MIIYQNHEIVIADKPSGISVQAGEKAGVPFLTLLEEKTGKLFPVHRLDRETSGLLLAARTSSAASFYSKLFAGGRVEKYYCAVCRGKFNSKSGEITEAVTVHGQEKTAHTSYRVRREFSRYTLLDLTLHTGRMHQIRVHLFQRGHPVIGDRQYGDFKLNREIKERYHISHLMLYARRLVIKEKKIDITLPMPAHFENFLSIFNVK